MRREYLINDNRNRRLIIFFTGWSTDCRILQDIKIPSGYDLLCCFDYRKIEWDTLQKDYLETIIIAWSFGVGVAEKLFSREAELKNLTGLYAVNGSPFPVDDRKGIPEKVFDATLANLSELSLQKFRKRICGGPGRYSVCQKYLSTDSSIPELKAELETFKIRKTEKEKFLEWDLAFVSENDKIFPISNLRKAWNGTPVEILKEEEHYPDFQKIIDLVIKDKENISRKFEKSIETYDENARIQSELSDLLLSLLSGLQSKKDSILEIGSGTGYLSRKIKSDIKPSEFTLIDLAFTSSSEALKNIKDDVEIYLKNIKSATFDIVISGSTVQWLHSPTRTFKEIKRILKPEGKFLFSTFIKGNLIEIADLSGKTLLYLEAKDWENISRRTGLTVEYVEPAVHTLYFDSAIDIFRHLKNTGVTALTGKATGIKEIKEMLSSYPREGEKYKLTYHTLIMVTSVK